MGRQNEIIVSLKNSREENKLPSSALCRRKPQRAIIFFAMAIIPRGQ